MTREGPTGGSVTTLNEMNRSRIVQALCREGVLTRAQLARQTELTPPAVTRIVADLINMGIIVETGEVKGKGARRAFGVSLNENRCHVLGVKLTRNRLEGAVFDLRGGFGAKGGFDIDVEYESSDVGVAIGTITRWINDRIAADAAIVAIGMAIPGPFTRDNCRVSPVSSMRAWKDVDFRETFCDAFSIPLFIEDDGRAGVLAQSMLSSQGPADESLAYFYIGESLSLGIIDHGEFLDGANGRAAQIGHMSIDFNGPKCECHGRGCLEQYCTSEAIVRLAREEYPGLVESVSSDDRSGDRELCQRIAKAALSKSDGLAMALLDRIAQYVGFGCVAIVNAFDPLRIVIGGANGLLNNDSNGASPILERIRRTVAQRVTPDVFERLSIESDALERDTVLCGAAAVAINHVLENPTRFLS